MNETHTTEAQGDEQTSACSDRGRPIYEGSGWLLCKDQELAFYNYRWSEGHEARFILSVAGTKEEFMRPGFVVVSCREVDSALHYSVVSPEDAYWTNSEHFGPVLSRDQAIGENGVYPDLWTFVDDIARLEPRLAQRIMRGTKAQQSVQPDGLACGGPAG
jgi:hypothetical protein